MICNTLTAARRTDSTTSEEYIGGDTLLEDIHDGINEPRDQVHDPIDEGFEEIHVSILA